MDVDQLGKSVDPAHGITVEVPDVQTIIDRARVHRRPRWQVSPWTAGSRRPVWAWLIIVIALTFALVFGFQVLPSSKPKVTAPVTRPTTPVASTPTSSLGEGITSVSLPTSSWFSQISVTGERLLLSGQVASSTNGSACVAATLDSQTLQLSDTTKRTCNDPAIVGEVVSDVNSNIPGTNDAIIRVARVDTVSGPRFRGSDRDALWGLLGHKTCDCLWRWLALDL